MVWCSSIYSLIPADTADCLGAGMMVAALKHMGTQDRDSAMVKYHTQNMRYI